MSSNILKIVLIGYGKMGKAIKKITEADQTIHISYVIDSSMNKDGMVFNHSAFIEADIAIDFSNPSAVVSNIKACLEIGKPIIVGTTGWLNHKAEIEELIKQKKGRVLYGSNFSLGVQLFNKLVVEAAKLFGQSSLFDASLNEVHHTQKVDAPSGTALTLAQSFLENAATKKTIKTELPNQAAVEKETFYVTSQRLGHVFGEHELRIDSEWDSITISHKAINREGFAAGAVKAAKWFSTKKEAGFYLVEDVIHEILS